MLIRYDSFKAKSTDGLEIRKTTELLSLFLFVYFICTLILRLFGLGSNFFFLDMQFKYNILKFQYNPINNWGNFFFYLLPLFMCIYSIGNKDNRIALELYCLLESLHLGASFLGMPYFLMLIFEPSVPNLIKIIKAFFWNFSILVVLGFLFRQCVVKIYQLDCLNDKKSNGYHKTKKVKNLFKEILTGLFIVFCYIAPFLA